jgi:hypothetical protein
MVPPVLRRRALRYGEHDFTVWRRFMKRTILGNLARCENFLAVVRSEPSVAEAYSDHVFRTVRRRLRELVARVVGEDDPDLDARTDLGPALLLYRAQVLRQLDDPDGAGDEAAALMLRPPAQ